MTGFPLHLLLRIAVVLGIAILFPLTVDRCVEAFVERPPLGPIALMSPDHLPDGWDKQNLPDLAMVSEVPADFYSVYFATTSVLGCLAILLGLPRRLGDIGTGFVLGGLATIVMGHLGAFIGIADALRFASALVALLSLLLMAWLRSSATQDLDRGA